MIIRNFRWDDLVDVVDVINQAQRARGFNNPIPEKVIRYKLERYFEAERDCFVALSSKGAIIGIGTMRLGHPDGTGLGVHDFAPGSLKKESGIGLIQATDARLKEKWSGTLPPNAQIRVERDIYDFEEKKKSILEVEGYQQTGKTLWMVMNLEKAVDTPMIPDDIEFRFFRPTSARVLYKLFQDIFDEEFGRSYDDWRDHYHLDESFFDSSWWPVAWKGNEIVGVSVCYADMHEEPKKTGWIDNIGVRADLRRQGIGKGLLQKSLENFQQRGFTKAVARPDGNNPFDVVSALQNKGFKIKNTLLWYEKILSDEG